MTPAAAQLSFPSRLTTWADQRTSSSRTEKAHYVLLPLAAAHTLLCHGSEMLTERPSPERQSLEGDPYTQAQLEQHEKGERDEEELFQERHRRVHQLQWQHVVPCRNMLWRQRGSPAGYTLSSWQLQATALPLQPHQLQQACGARGCDHTARLASAMHGPQSIPAPRTAVRTF